MLIGTVTVVLTSPTLGGRLFFIQSNTQILDLPNSMSQSVDSGGSVVISNAGKRERERERERLCIKVCVCVREREI